MSASAKANGEWATVTLASAVDILDSRRVPVNAKERELRSGDVPYYGATGQVGTIDTHLFDEELVLLGEDGAPFLDSGKPKAYLIRGKSWVNNHAHVLRAKEGLSNAFLLYQLNTVNYRPFVSGTTRLKLPQGPMKQIPLLVPTIDEQHQVVAEIEKHFTRLDAGVAALRRVQANLKRYRASVLKSACEGRLVPTEAKLARAQGRTFETGAELLARILTERRTKWSGRGRYKEPDAIPPPLPSLPEGWEWATLSSLTMRIADVDHKMPKAVDVGVPYVSTRDFKTENGVDFGGAKRISRADYDALCKKVMPERGDILLSRYGTVGEVRSVRTAEVFQASYSIAILKTLPDPVMNAYLISALRSEAVQAQIRRDVRASAQPDLGLEFIRRFAIPLPPAAEQLRIVAEVDRRLSVLDALEALVTSNLQRATRLRQSILQRAFAGELVPQEGGREVPATTVATAHDTVARAPSRPERRKASGHGRPGR